MVITATEIDLTQWADGDLREDVRRCATALSLLSEDSPAYAGLARAISDAVAELARRSPAPGKQLRATMCRCGEVFTSPGQAAAHFSAVFVPAGMVGADGRIHQEIPVPGARECPVPGPDHGARPCEDGCRGRRM